MHFVLFIEPRGRIKQIKNRIKQIKRRRK